MKRRAFLSGALWTAVGLAWPASAASERRLLLVHLFGGNDGLSMLPPLDEPLYRRARPSLAVGRGQALSLGRGSYLHGAMRPLLPLWEARRLAIVQGVGYPSPSLSHFRSIEIWHSARHLGTADAGWLSRLKNPLLCVGEVPLAVVPRTPLAVRAGHDFLLPRRDGAYVAALDAMYRDAPPQLRDTYASMRGAMTRLQRLSTNGFPDTPVGQALSAASGFLGGGTIAHVTVGGWDTHAGQAERHARQMSELAQALSVVVERHKDALIVVYSEFGRRVEENASGGTDHGTAGPVLLLGGGVRGGLYGERPSLSQLEDGDLRHTVDFRSVYATILTRWLRVDAIPFLGGHFNNLSCL